MNALIKYTLTESGQREAIAILGVPTPKQQQIEVEPLNGYLSYFAPAADGSLSPASLVAAQDHILTSNEALAALKAQQDKRAEEHAAMLAAEAQRKAEQAAKQAIVDQQMLDALRAAALDPGARWEFWGGSASGKPKGAIGGHWSTPLTMQAEAAPFIAEMQRRNKADAAIAERLKALPKIPSLSTSLAAPGRGAGFAKVLTSVSPTAKDGYGYTGDWGVGSAVLGEVILIVLKRDVGSRKHPRIDYDATLYVRGPLHYHVARNAQGQAIESGEDSWAIDIRKDAIAFLALDPSGRVRQTIAARIAAAEAKAAKCAPSPEDGDVARAQIAERRKAIEQVAETLRDELASLDPDPADAAIKDLDQAAAAILSAGYRELAKRYHPDQGGSEQVMSLLNQAKSQLREMLALTQAVAK